MPRVRRGTKTFRNGKAGNKQRCLCGDKDYPGRSFILEYTYNDWKPGIDERIIGMATNASRIRDTTRVLKVSKQKVSDTFKKRKRRQAGSISDT